MAKIQFYAQKVPDKPMQWENRQEVDQFRSDAAPGRWRFDVVREKKPRSQKQLGDMFGNIVATITHEVNEVRQEGVDSLLQFLVDPSIPKGQAATDDFIKAVCYMIAPTFGEDGRKKTLRSMNTAEAAHFTDRIRNIFANYVEIPEPDPRWQEKETKKNSQK